MLQNLNEGHTMHLHIQHNQLSPKIHHSPKQNTRRQVTTTAKNLAMMLLRTKLVQINETDKQVLTQINHIFTTVVSSKNQSQKPSHDTKVIVPNN